MQKLKFLSLNVRGLREFKKRKKVLTWLKHKKPNIAFLRETHSTSDNEKFWSFRLQATVFILMGHTIVELSGLFYVTVIIL